MSRVVIVSNRLPVTSTLREDGQITFVPSAGGVATGLSSMTQGADTVLWVGWPGAVPKSQQKLVAERLRAEHRCEPVFLSDRIIEKFYEGFSNRTLWPVFHSFQSYAKFSANEWESYKEANQRFLQALDQILLPGDRVWIHDYQLMLLPNMLRERHPNSIIGFFLHIPFPSFDVFRLLPQNKQILEGLLGADLVGFHTDDYSRAFLNCTHRTFGIEDRLGQIDLGDRYVQTVVHPMGIDMAMFETSPDPNCPEFPVADITAALSNVKTIFSVSRLDYTKGIPQSLESYELFLERHRERHGKVAFVLAVVPSREKVERYAHLKREIDEAVGRINSKYGTIDWQPIRYIYRSLSFEELKSLYKLSDVALVTPLRDGMNLVAKEFVGTRSDEDGVLILSEMAGAAKELLESLIVNPNSREELCEALEVAFAMPANERKSRMRALRDRLRESPIHDWGHEFVDKLMRARTANTQLVRNAVDTSRIDEFATKYQKSKRRLFILDYDGTLMPFMGDPKRVTPDSNLVELLRGLSSDPKNDVLILSGRSKRDLEAFLGRVPVSLSAEHGASIKWKGDTEWSSTVANVKQDWKEKVRDVLRIFVEKIPGSWTEEKEFALVWHYRRSERESSDVAARELTFHLLTSIGESPVRIVPGNRSIEIRCFGVGKGALLNHAVNFSDYDFILAAGDDLTDEDMFAVLPERAATIRVGSGWSRASSRVRDQFELRRLLKHVATPTPVVNFTGVAAGITE